VLYSLIIQQKLILATIINKSRGESAEGRPVKLWEMLEEPDSEQEH
jgi:hypothetical protein